MPIPQWVAEPPPSRRASGGAPACGVVSVLAGGAIRCTGFARNDVVAGGDVVEYAAGSLRKLVEPRIDVSQAGTSLHSAVDDILIEKREYAREERGSGRRAAGRNNRPGLDDQIRVVDAGCGECNVRSVACIVVRHAGSGLPGRPGKDAADTAAAGVQECARSCVVPAYLGDVGHGRSEVRLVCGGPVFACAFGERGAAHRGHFRHARRRVDRDSADPDLILILVFARGRARVPGRGDPGDPLGDGLLRQILIPAPAALPVDLANAEAKAEYWGNVLLNRVLKGLDYTLRIHIHDRSARRASARILHIEQGLAFGIVDPRVRRSRDQQHFGFARRQTGEHAEVPDVLKIYCGFARHRDPLPGAGDALLKERSEIVDHCQVARSDGMRPITGAHLRPERQLIHVREIVQTYQRVDQRFELRGYRNLLGVRIVGPAVDLVTMQVCAESLTDLGGSAAESNVGAALRGKVHLEALRDHPISDFVEVLLTEAESFAVLFRRQPGVIEGRIRILLIFEEPFEFSGLSLGRPKSEAHAGDAHRVFDRSTAGHLVDSRISAPAKNRLCPGLNPAGQTLRLQKIRLRSGNEGNRDERDWDLGSHLSFSTRHCAGNPKRHIRPLHFVEFAQYGYDKEHLFPPLYSLLRLVGSMAMAQPQGRLTGRLYGHGTVPLRGTRNSRTAFAKMTDRWRITIAFRAFNCASKHRRRSPRHWHSCTTISRIRTRRVITRGSRQRNSAAGLGLARTTWLE